jgi:PAS domain S-box-containing protein
VRRLTFKVELVVGVAAALTVLCAVGVLSYRRVSEEDSDAAWVVHTHRVIETLDGLLTDLVNAETGQRGYLLTGTRSYLQPYTSAAGRLQSDYDLARKLTADNPAQQNRLDRMAPLIASKLAELKRTIAIRRSQGLAASAALVQTDEGKHRMDRIRALIAQMKKQEERLLVQRLDADTAAVRNAKALILVGYTLSFLCLFAAGWPIYQEMGKRSRAEVELHHSEERFRLMVSNVQDHAIYLLDPQGRVLTWNIGSERMKGYSEKEILGRHYSVFHTAEDQANGLPERNLETAVRDGHVTCEGRRVRKDGSRFWASAVLTALRDETAKLRGFGKVTRDLTQQKQAEEEMKIRNAQLETANKELEAFCYSVSHDLRAPLRGIDGFSQALLEDQADQIDDQGKAYLHRIRAATQRMGELIDDLLSLSRVTRAEFLPKPTNLSEMACSIADDLRRQQPGREVEFVVAPDLQASADPHLMRILLENLLGNSWKFTSKRERARIEFGRTEQNGSSVFFVRDNGAGFDLAYSGRLFGAFQRLHSMEDFPGTGVGLATVQRIVHRHGGGVWAEGAVGRGATFYFRL